MKKIIALVIALQVMLFADFKSVNTTEFEALVKKGAPIIDIRTPGEWEQTGVIEGSHKIMFFNERGEYDIQKFMNELTQVVKDQDTPFILVCRTASRTKIVGDFLSNTMNYKHVKELSGGIVFGWSNQNKALVK